MTVMLTFLCAFCLGAIAAAGLAIQWLYHPHRIPPDREIPRDFQTVRSLVRIMQTSEAARDEMLRTARYGQQ